MKIPYEILKADNLPEDKLLENVYYKGQDKIWDGKELLSELKYVYPDRDISDEKKESLRRIFSVILWGELIAWKVSAQLAQDIDYFEAKMAATSQAHDEARHFYVMKDYLKDLGCEPVKLPKHTEKFLERVLNTKSLLKKLVGMQLMVEPVAITIFKLVKESNVDPLLSELLSYYERDEARHIALGVKYLPTLLRNSNPLETSSLAFFQLKCMIDEVEGLKELEKDFQNLGFGAEEVFRQAEKRQLDVLNELSDQMSIPRKIWVPLQKVVSLKKELTFSSNNIFQLFSKEIKRNVYW